MITKGIIKTIDYNTNICNVRIPIFESTDGAAEFIESATIATLPGAENSYKENDVVIVAFEDKALNKPIILGKLYLGGGKEENRGAIKCDSLSVSGNATLPVATKLSFDGDTSTIVNVDKGPSTYKTVNDIIGALQQQTSKIEENKQEIGEKVTANTNSTTTGFGWTMDENGWRIKSFDESRDPIDIMTVDNSGVAIAGDLKLVGYPKDTKITYRIWSADKNMPQADIDNNALWTSEAPTRTADKPYLWQRTTIMQYEYESGNIVEKWISTAFCVDSQEARPVSEQTYYIVRGEDDPAPDVDDEGWTPTPDALKAGEVYWIKIETKYNNGVVIVSTPVKDATSVITQGKSRIYYGSQDPYENTLYKDTIVEGDCWFDTRINYIEHGTFATKEQYIGYYKRTGSASNYTYTEITGVNYENTDFIIVESTIAFERQAHTLREWKGSNTAGAWENIGNDLIVNRVTANYINAMDIIAKKIKIIGTGTNNTVFSADGFKNKVEIAGFTVDQNSIYNGSPASWKSGDVLVSRGTDTALPITGAPANTKNWAFASGKNFGVTNNGDLYASSATITGTINASSGKIGNNDKSFSLGTSGSGTNTIAQIKSGMESLNDTTNDGVYIGTDGIALGKGAFKVAKDGTITISGYATSSDLSDVEAEIPSESDITTITNNTISTTNVTATNLKVKAANIEGTVTAGSLLVKDSSSNTLLDAGYSDTHKVFIGGFTVDNDGMWVGISSPTQSGSGTLIRSNGIAQHGGIIYGDEIRSDVIRVGAGIDPVVGWTGNRASSPRAIVAFTVTFKWNNEGESWKSASLRSSGWNIYSISSVIAAFATVRGYNNSEGLGGVTGAAMVYWTESGENITLWCANDGTSVPSDKTRYIDVLVIGVGN